MFLAARKLDSTTYGSLSLMLNTAQTWSLFIAGTVSITLARYVGRYRADDPARAASLIFTMLLSVFCIAILLALGAALASPLLSAELFDGGLSPLDVVILAVWTAMLTLQSSFQGAVTGLEQFRRNTWFALAGGSTTLFLMVVIVPPDLYWIAVALMTGVAVTTTLMGMLIHQTIGDLSASHRARFDSRKLLALVQFGLPAFAGGLLQTQSQWFANLQLATQENGLHAMAGLNVSLQWYAIMLFVPGAVANAMLPLLSRLNHDSQQRVVFTAGLSINLVVAIGAAIVVFLLSERILALYGSAYTEFNDAFKHFCIAAAIAGGTTMLSQQLMSMGRAIVSLLISGIWAATFLGSIFMPGGSTISIMTIGNAYIAANAVQCVTTLLALIIFSLMNQTGPYRSIANDQPGG